MPHASLKLLPTVNQNRTPALNEAGISQSQLIRFMADDKGVALPQKLGGWTKFYSTAMTSTVRCLWAWADINSNKYLGVGCTSSLNTILSGTLRNITPRTFTDTPAISTYKASTVSGSNAVNINDPSSGVTGYDSVFIETQISVGGLVLFGVYQCYNPSSDPNNYTIYATDTLGNPALATSTSSASSLPQFSTTSGSSVVSVTLANHGYSAGSTFPVITSTSVGGITFSGNYTVTSVTSSSVFTIQASNSATSTTTGYLNSNNASYLYYVGIGPDAATTGYGYNGYGSGGWNAGATPPNTGSSITATDWTLDNWGSILVACPYGGPIYIWDPTISPQIATVIPQAPQANAGIFVAMPERQIIAWGSTTNGILDPLLVRWCDITNLNSWVATVINQAGSYRIPRGSLIVGGIQGPQQGLLWTDLAVWAMQYVGQPYIYSFNEIGTGCGLIAPKAASSMNGIVYWMSQTQFFMLSGEGVTPIYCPIWDVIFQTIKDLNASTISKIRIATNSQFGEVSWYYPSVNGGENTNYVKYNINTRGWDYGSLDRTSWINQSVFGPPIGTSSSNYIYQHETSTDADDQPLVASLQTGYFAMAEGDLKSFVDLVWPDMKWGYYGGDPNANVQITFYVTDYPGDTPVTYGPYEVTQSTKYFNTRFRGRLVSIGVSSNDIGSFWRLGNIRYRMQPDGKF
jgi:hypothetical protein